MPRTASSSPETSSPGRQVQLAVFGINGPLSSPPTNFIWMRLARLEFYKDSVRGPYPVEPQEVNVDVVRLDPALDEIVPPNPKIFKVAEGFQFTEGPDLGEGRRLSPLQRPEREPHLQVHGRGGAVGLQGKERVRRRRRRRVRSARLQRHDPRPAGPAHDRRARQPARRPRWRRAERSTVLADRYQGKRLNSPNDLVYRSDGALVLHRPAVWLSRSSSTTRGRSCPCSGVFSLREGEAAACGRRS